MKIFLSELEPVKTVVCSILLLVSNSVFFLSGTFLLLIMCITTPLHHPPNMDHIEQTTEAAKVFNSVSVFSLLKADRSAFSHLCSPLTVMSDVLQSTKI